MMSNNVNRTFLTLIWIPWRIPHRRIARGGHGWMSPVTVEKSQKNMHRNDEFSRNFRHFSSDVPLRQKNALSLAKFWLRAWCRNYASRLSKSKTSLNYGCTVVLPALCRLLLSALVNQAGTAGRTSNLDKTGMLRRMCRWASIVLAFKLQRSSSLRMLYALTSLSTSQECGLAARSRARSSDIGNHS